MSFGYLTVQKAFLHFVFMVSHYFEDKSLKFTGDVFIDGHELAISSLNGRGIFGRKALILVPI